MDVRRIGIATCARSDWGHTSFLHDMMDASWVQHGEPFGFHDIEALIIPTDRWEMGVMACQALGAGVPIIQLHAGESTPYCFDDDVRQFVSRVAAVRFCCHDVHRKRLLSMGIPDWTIAVTGAPGLDKLLLPRPSRDVLARQLHLDPARQWALVILHPTTRPPQHYDPAEEMRSAELAIEDRQAIWFTPGNDPGAKPYRRPGQVETVTDATWRGLLYEADLMIGNSSAMIIEAPFVGLKTFEIGVRQAGRDRVPYGDGKSIPRIVEILKGWQP